MMDGVSKLVQDSANSVVRYNELGENDENSQQKFSEVDTVAMSLPRVQGGLFKVKVDKKGRLYNPLKAGQTKDYSLGKLDRTTNSPKFKLVDGSERKFNLFVQFLKTLNNSLIDAADRE